MQSPCALHTPLYRSRSPSGAMGRHPGGTALTPALLRLYKIRAMGEHYPHAIRQYTLFIRSGTGLCSGRLGLGAVSQRHAPGHGAVDRHAIRQVARPGAVLRGRGAAAGLVGSALTRLRHADARRAFSPTCRQTIPDVRGRCQAQAKPAARISSSRSSAVGKLRIVSAR